MPALSRKGQESASDADWDVSWRVHVMSHVFAARALVRACSRAAKAICSIRAPPPACWRSLNSMQA